MSAMPFDKVPAKHRTFLACLCVCSLACGCDGTRHEDQGEVSAAILKWGGDVLWHDPRWGPPVDARPPCKAGPGGDNFVIAVYNSTTSPTSPTLDMTDERLPLVAGLNELRFLQLGDTKVTDAGLKYLRGLTLLTDLDLSHTRVTDNGLADIEGLTH